jgi:iron complex transport system ATP-binding protein
MSVRELVKLGRFAWRGAVRRWTAEDLTAVAEAMQMTGVAHFADRQADTLSGGERQRAWVAMLLAQAAPMLLLDEPTSALDLAHQYETAALLKRLDRQAGRSVVVVLHDINLAARFADRLIVLRQGRVAFDGSAAELMQPALLSDLFGVAIDLVDHSASGRPIAVVNS